MLSWCGWQWKCLWNSVRCRMSDIGNVSVMKFGCVSCLILVMVLGCWWLMLNIWGWLCIGCVRWFFWSCLSMLICCFVRFVCWWYLVVGWSIGVWCWVSVWCFGVGWQFMQICLSIGWSVLMCVVGVWCVCVLVIWCMIWLSCVFWFVLCVICWIMCVVGCLVGGL